MDPGSLYFIFTFKKFASFHGFVPFCNGHQSPKLLLLNKICVVIVCFIVIGVKLYFDSIKYSKLEEPDFITKINYFKEGLLTLGVLNGLLAANVLNFKWYLQLERATNVCYKLFPTKANKVKPILIISACNIYMFSLLAYDAYVSKDVESNIIFENLEAYYIYMTLLYILAYFTFIGRCLQYYHNKLENWSLIQPFDLIELKKICSFSQILCDLIQSFTRVYGVHIFLVLMVSLLDILLTINTILGSALQDYPKLLETFIWWTITLFLPGIISAHLCETIKTNVQDILHTCSRNSYRYTGEIREEFKFLAEQMVLRAPKISAAGFVVIDHNLLFTLSNMLVTYLVVLVQMTPKKN